jgi:hypothetical protein
MANKRKQKSSLERRMVDIGQMVNTSDLLRLRTAYIQATNHYAEEVWPTSILDILPKGKQLDAIMLRIQSTFKGSLSSVWAEKARIDAKNKITEQHKRAISKLWGKFKNLASVGDKPLKSGIRRLLNFPEEWSEKLSDQDVVVMSKLADTMNTTGMLELFTKLQHGHNTSLTTLQGEALLAMLRMVEERFGCPQWRQDGTVMLHLDFRCFAGGRETQNAILASRLEKLKTLEKCEVPFLISGVVARGTPLKLTATVYPNAVKRLIDNASSECLFTSLALEIGPTTTKICGVLTQKPVPYTLAEATHILGDDFGFANTSAQVIVPIDQELNITFFEEASTWTKSQAKKYLETHIHDGQALHQVLHDGRDFLKVIQKHSLHIDKLRSDIDCIYNRIRRIKESICAELNISLDGKIDLKQKTNNKRINGLLEKMPKLLSHVEHLKMLRREGYRKISSIKKCWFGWLSNRKAETARYYHAVVVREDLTILAKEKGSSDYKGRTFNKMLNNGAKGQYLRLASQKLRWFGIPEMVVPSYYTSCTDITCGVVDKKQRRTQDRFVGQNGVSQQADIHAALTLALYPLLRPKSVNAKETQVFPNQQVNGNVYQEVNASINQVTNISISG